MLRWLIDLCGEKVELRDVEKSNLVGRYPIPYLRECMKQRKWTGKPSTTQLIKGSREAYLMIVCDYAVTPEDCAYMILGSMAHITLENAAPIQELAEIRLEGEESGIVDLVEEVDGKYRLIDYKTAGAYKIKKSIGLGMPVDLHDWTLQLNNYRMKMEKCIKIDSMKVFAIVRDGGTWQLEKDGINKTYMIDIPFMADSEVKKYFDEKREVLLKALKGYEKSKKEYKDRVIDNIPPKCTPVENWNGNKCSKYCAVSVYCKSAEKEKKEMKKNRRLKR